MTDLVSQVSTTSVTSSFTLKIQLVEPRREQLYIPLSVQILNSSFLQRKFFLSLAEFSSKQQHQVSKTTQGLDTS